MINKQAVIKMNLMAEEFRARRAKAAALRVAALELESCGLPVHMMSAHWLKDRASKLEEQSDDPIRDNSAS